MKNVLLYTLVITLLGMVGFGGNSVEAASGPTSWSQKLKCETSCPRFVVLNAWDDAAVLDKETGLVWEQSPSTTLVTWESAQIFCNTKVVSSRMGWRLPTFQELSSLVDFTQANPTIPSGHPFSNVVNSYYWSSTTSTGSATLGWGLSFADGDTDIGPKNTGNHAWCVRGGSGVDAQ